ncbi:MAG: hypothetical protein ABJF23_34185 [Bryobacteraceae bacterium]
MLLLEEAGDAGGCSGCYTAAEEVSTALGDQRRQMLFGLGIGSFRNEEGDVLLTSFEERVRTRFPSTARIRMLASRTSDLPGILLFSRLTLRISFSDAPHAAIMASSSFATARIASTPAL